MVEIKSLPLLLVVLILNFHIESVYQVGSESLSVLKRTLKIMAGNYEMKLDFLFNIL